MKLVTTVEFSVEDIKNLLTDEAKKQIGAGAGTSKVEFSVEGGSKLMRAVVSFEDLKPKGK